MALRIVKDNCIGCTACELVCPNEAIYELAGGLRAINPERCTECVGFYEEPQCAGICPIPDTCVPDPEHRESREALLAKKLRLHGA